MNGFSVSFQEQDGIVILKLKGELDAHTASELEAAFQRCLDEGKVKVVVDGSELQYISSAGLGVFMAFVDEIRERGGDIKIAALQPKVYKVFDLLGFPMVFDIVATVEEAIKRFQEPKATSSEN